jgi:hypothetical protein
VYTPLLAAAINVGGGGKTKLAFFQLADVQAKDTANDEDGGVDDDVKEKEKQLPQALGTCTLADIDAIAAALRDGKVDGGVAKMTQLPLSGGTGTATVNISLHNVDN